MLILLPNLLDETADHTYFLPKAVEEAVFEMEGLIAEDEKNARKFLKRFSYSQGRTFRNIPIKLLNEHSKKTDLEELLALLKQGKTWGLVSDCGLPCIADPGADLVFLARKHHIPVKTLPGPSSLMMALQLSGLYSQQFTFSGYLPKDESAMHTALKVMEKEILEKAMVYVFIEAPYRSDKLLMQLQKYLNEKIILCAACDLTMESEDVTVLPISQWKKENLIKFHKRQMVCVVGKAR
jgi:16S rRNA (cytidine1402-2'-O)-methyltransferase